MVKMKKSKCPAFIFGVEKGKGKEIEFRQTIGRPQLDEGRVNGVWRETVLTRRRRVRSVSLS